MAMISSLVQKKKKSPFTAGKIEGVSCSQRSKGFPSMLQNHHDYFFAGNYSPQLI